MDIVNKMAGAESRLRFKVYLDEEQRVAEIFVTPVTKCRDIVQRLQRQIHETDCFLIEVWQGCERLVPDNESILSTLLEWGSDLEDVKFYLRPREDTPSYTQVVNGPSSQRVNGFKEEPPVVRDVLLGGSRISVNDLKEFAARQQQEIVAKERELKARQIQLMEMKKKSQNKPQNPYIQQLSAKADEQDQRMTALRNVQDQVDSFKLSNTALAEELDNVRTLFMEKEKELAIAVAKVESLTQQLDKQRKGWSQSSPSREKTHQELELERLRKELMTRNELNHQQSVQIQSQKQLLAEKHKELFELDSQIDKYTNDLRQKRSQNNHINHPANGSVSSTDEQDFLDMDYYSNLGSFSKRSSKTNGSDSKSTGNAPVTSGSFRGRARNARKLETLLEVEEEVSDGHASNKSSTEDLTQGPGPPRASRMTALKSRFEMEGANEGGKSWSSRERGSGGNKEVVSSLNLRVAPEGVETPISPAPEMFDLDEERRKHEYSLNEFLDISSLKLNPPGRDAIENTETRNSTMQEGAFEVPHSLEIKHILGGLDLKPQVPSCSTESSTPSDGGDYSGPSSPSSLSSSSSISSNSASPKTAVFALTGVAKKTNNGPRLSEPLQQRNPEKGTKTLPQSGLQGQIRTVESEGVPNGKNFESFSAEPEQPSRGGLTSEGRTVDHPLQTRLVKSEAFPTKNENVGSFARATVLDFSRTGMKPKRFDETGLRQNEATIGSDEQQVPRLTEVRGLDIKPSPISVVTSKSNDISRNSDGKRVPNLEEFKTTDSTVKTGKVQLSRLRYSPAPPRRQAVLTDELQTRFERQAEDPSRNSNENFLLEDSKKAMDSSLETDKKTALANAPLPRLPQNFNEANDLKSSLSAQESNEGDKFGHAVRIRDETDNAKSLSNEQSAGSATVDLSQVPPPLTFKPISFRAKKLAADQSNKNTSDNRSQLVPPIANSISIRGQASSLTKITVTPAASYYLTRNANIPEKRSPVPTSKRQRFFHRGVAPSFPEVKELLSNDGESGDDALHESNEQKTPGFEDKESLDKETTLTNREQENKQRQTPRSDAKHVVSSFNIQLSGQSRKQIKKQGDVSPSSEQSNTSYVSEEKQFNSGSGRLSSESVGVSPESGRLHYDSGRLSSESGRHNYESSRPSSEGDRLGSESVHHDSGRLSSESGRHNYESSRPSSEGDRLGSESGRISSESGRLSSVNGNDKSPTFSFPEGQKPSIVNGENVAGSAFRKTQLEQPSRNVFTSRLLKPLSPPKQISSPLKTEETFPSNNVAQKVVVSYNSELLQSELSPTRTWQIDNKGDINLETTPTDEYFDKSVATKDIVTIKDFPLKITDVDTGIPVSANGDIRLTSQSHNPISGQLSAAIKDFPVTTNFDNKTKPDDVNGDIARLNHSLEDFSKESLALEESTQGSLATARSDRKKKARHVSLDPHAVLLDAAVEGELELVKLVIREVENPSKPNSDGITALHNAVCASHDEVVHFLVEYGADINSPDSHGWTPLHCAAANNATELARFLIEHGACIFAATSLEKKTPLQCCERGLSGYFNCMKYLNDVQQNFGLLNDGRVFALYTYSADEQDELSFECGEELQVLKRGDATEKEWWWAKNKNGETGYIPRNLLGLHARMSPEDC